MCWSSSSTPTAGRPTAFGALPKYSPPSQTPSEYRPISITPILSKIFERLLVKCLFSFVNRLNVLPSTQFGLRKGLGICDALLHLIHDLQLALDKGFESRVVSSDFSSALDSVNHAGLIFKLQSIGVGGLLLNILILFLFNNNACSVLLSMVFIAHLPQFVLVSPRIVSWDRFFL